MMHKSPLGQHGASGNLAGWIAKATKLNRGEWLGVLSFLECSSNEETAIATSVSQRLRPESLTVRSAPGYLSECEPELVCTDATRVGKP